MSDLEKPLRIHLLYCLLGFLSDDEEKTITRSLSVLLEYRERTVKQFVTARIIAYRVLNRDLFL